MKETLNIHLGRSNLSATIFVPSDCTNNCKFCTSKESYSQRKPNLEKVLKKIRKLNKIDWIQSFVLTGGEPFADLSVLSAIIGEIAPSKKIYVNTTLPTGRYSEDELALYTNASRIDGVNVSRHGSSLENDQKMFCKDIAGDDILLKMYKPVKINHIYKPGEDLQALLDRWVKYPNAFLSLRADYRYVTKGSLKDLQSDDVTSILRTPNVQYIGHGGCDVCFDVTFLYDKKFYFSLHRGMEHSSVSFGNELILNDIIVSQDGKIYYDWDMKDTKLKVKDGLLIVE